MKTKEIIGLLVILAFFVAGIFLAQRYAPTIENYLDIGFLGMLVYVFLGILATVIAPITTVPLIPVASELWGPFLTAILTIVSWVAGDVLTFFLARRFGQPLVGKFVSLKKISKYEKVLGERHLFWNIVFVRIALPVDILGYVIGLFTSIKFNSYFWAIVLGSLPFSFLASYAADSSLEFQIVAGIIVFGMLLVGYKRIRKKMEN